MFKSLYIALLGLILLFPTRGDPYFFREGYNYAPACQWIRIRGKIDTEGIPKYEKFYITVYSQSEEQEKPVTLVTNYPINPDYFSLVFSGLDQKLEGVSFIPLIYSFQEEIEFFYFVKSGDGKFKSRTERTVYHPQRIEKEGEVLCQSDLKIPPISFIHN